MPKKALAVSLLLSQALLLAFSVSGTILPTVRADLGVELTPVNEGSKLGDGYSAQQIFTIAPNSSAERADLRIGDRLSEEVSLGIVFDALPIEPKQSISVVRDGRTFFSTVNPTLIPIETSTIVYKLKQIILSSISLVIALILIFGDPQIRSLKTLAFAFVAYSFVTLPESLEQMRSANYLRASNQLFYLCNFIVAAAFFRFWLQFAEDAKCAFHQRWRRIERGVTAVALFSSLLTCVVVISDYLWYNKFFFPLQHSIFDSAARFVYVVNICGLILGSITVVVQPAILILRARGTLRNTMYWLLVTLFFLFFPPALLMWTEVESTTVTYSAYAGETLALVGFLYLILSTDLISFPFVINRTAVYLATGTLLVFSFFSLKIVLESIVGSNTASKTEILNGVIAALGFVARQFKGAAESTLRRLVFADLGRREDSLRAHSRDAFHYRSTDTLKRDSVNAISDFLYGVKVDFFESNESIYVGLTTGHTVGIDSLIGVKMRAAGSSSTADALQSDQTFAICIPGYSGADLVFFLGIWRDDSIPSIRPDELRAIESFAKELSSALAHIELRELKQTYVAR